MQITGFEKAWAAATPGLAAATVTVLWWALGLFGAVTPPGEDELRAAFAIIVTAGFSALGAYTATNTTPPKETAE